MVHIEGATAYPLKSVEFELTNLEGKRLDLPLKSSVNEDGTFSTNEYHSPLDPGEAYKINIITPQP